MFCQSCGTKIDDNSVVFCPSCGARQGSDNNSVSPSAPNNNSNYSNAPVEGQGELKEKWVTFALALLLGGFGVHKFYEGNTKTGVIYLTVSLVGGFITFGLASLVIAILALVDAIKVLSMPDRYIPKF